MFRVISAFKSRENRSSAEICGIGVCVAIKRKQLDHWIGQPRGSIFVFLETPHLPRTVSEILELSKVAKLTHSGNWRYSWRHPATET
jgi:hypothetical protein